MDTKHEQITEVLGYEQLVLFDTERPPMIEADVRVREWVCARPLHWVTIDKVTDDPGNVILSQHAYGIYMATS